MKEAKNDLSLRFLNEFVDMGGQIREGASYFIAILD
jgi:hypothetical protein